MPDDASVAQDDLAAILRALGLGDHARTEPPHEVVHSEVLPAIRELAGKHRTTGPDPCADIPDAPEPGEYVPAPGELWRPGRKNGRAIWRVTAGNPTGEFIGALDSPELVRLAVSAVNAELALRQGNPPASRADLGESPYPELYQVLRDCEALLAGRNAGNPELIHADLRRMRGELKRAIRAVENMGEGDEHG